MTRVNIIYTRGTVARLLPFLETVLEHTEWPLTLVANGIDPDELHSLDSVAASKPNLIDVVTASRRRILPHGEVLDLLLAREKSPYFCAVDSDILVTGAIDLRELLPSGDQVGLCSGVPVWHQPNDLTLPEGYQVAHGRFVRTARSDVLGCSYAFAYRTTELRQVLDQWAISLRTYRWKEIPVRAQSELRRRGLGIRIFDTAKLANLLLHRDDARVDYAALPRLIHLGGQSGRLPAAGVRRWPGVRSARSFVSRRYPATVRAVWRARRVNRAESVSIADFAVRRSEAMRTFDAIADGSMSLSDRPDWLDPDAFCAVASALQHST